MVSVSSKNVNFFPLFSRLAKISSLTSIQFLKYVQLYPHELKKNPNFSSRIIHHRVKTIYFDEWPSELHFPSTHTWTMKFILFRICLWWHWQTLWMIRSSTDFCILSKVVLSNIFKCKISIDSFIFLHVLPKYEIDETRYRFVSGICFPTYVEGSHIYT